MNRIAKEARFAAVAGLCCLVAVTHGAPTSSFAQESIRAPDIEGPHGSSPVGPVEANIDLSQTATTAAVSPAQAPGTEVPLREIPLEEGRAGAES